MTALKRWLFVIAGTAALVALLIGLLAGGPAPASPSPTVPLPSSSPTAAAPSATPIQTNGPVTSYWVYFVRDQLPPLGATIQAHAEQNAVDRTVQRIGALMRAGAQTPPSGTTNPAALIRSRTTVSGGSTVAVPAVSVRIEGDLATAEFDIEDWGVRGSAIAQGLLQQLVYTITEEPGIRRAMIVEKGKPSSTIDQLVVDKPLAREDVIDYGLKGTDVTSIENAGSGAALEIPSSLISNGILSNGRLGVAGRVSVEVRTIAPPGTTRSGRLDPTFRAELAPLKDPCIGPACKSGKWRIVLTIPGSGPWQPTYQDLISGPIRSVDGEVVQRTCPPGASSCPPDTVISVYVDDARPWRVSVGPAGPGAARINVDIGGRPTFVNKNIAVYGLDTGITVGRTLTVPGAARVFEANVAWRVRDGSGKEVARGYTTATLGTSPVWGTFEAKVEVPASVTGDVTLEVFHVSPKDGSDEDVVSVPLTVR